MKSILRITPQAAVMFIMCAGMLFWRAGLSPVSANCGTCGVPAPASGGAQGQSEQRGENSGLDRVRMGMELFRIINDANRQPAEQPQTAERPQQSAEHQDEHPTTRERPASPGAPDRTARDNGNAEPPSVCPLANERWLCDRNLELSEDYCDALDKNAARQVEAVDRALKAVNAVNPAVPLINAIQQNPPPPPQPQAGSDAIYDALRVIDTVNPVAWVRSWLGGAEPGCGIIR